MKTTCVYFLIGTLCCFVGCSFNSKTIEAPSTEQTPFIEFGRVINEKALASGATFVFIPFKAGAGVELNENLDRTALMIVKGLGDTLEEKKSRFKLLFNSQADEAHFIIEGRFTHWSHTPRWKKIFGKKKVVLGVSGRIKDRTSKKTIIAFSDLQEEFVEEINHENLGYKVGVSLAHYLMSKE